VVDEVLELLDGDPDYRFTLDGQLATVDDYLAIRPENEERLRQYVRAGRLAIGPWQTLVDEFLVSGETIVRNLERGLARAADFGDAMRIGYLPDSFGHVAQMPQILRLFGIEDAVVWRGVPAAIDRHAFRWEAPDGSAVRAEYLPAGYGNAAHAFDGPEHTLDALEHALLPWYEPDAVLAMVGTDHMPPVRLPHGVPVGTLRDYLAAARSADGEATWRGELRSGARANLLPGCVSARIDLKRAAAHAERALERYAEPLQALYGDGGAEPFLREAWTLVLQNAAHDSICGCSADEVSAQVLVRYAEAEQIGRELARRAVDRIAAGAPRGTVVVVNPSARPRTDLVELDLVVPPGWPAVGLETPEGEVLATQELHRQEPLLWEGPLVGIEGVRRRIHGRELFGRVLNGFRLDGSTVTLDVGDEPEPEWLDVEQLVREIELATAEGEWTLRIVARPRRTLVALVTAPPLGWTSLRPVEREGANAAPLDLGVDPEAVTRIVRGRDLGDSYNYAPPADEVAVDEPQEQRVEQIETGPFRAVSVLHRTYAWDGHRVATRTRLERRAGEPLVRIRIEFDNPCEDQRIRVHVPLDETADRSRAEGQFAVVERGLEPEGGYGEVPVATYPAHGFVEAGGTALLLDHVTEYEVVDERELALTVLRSTGLISRSDNRYREDPAGPEIPIPAAQLRGPWSFELALRLDGADPVELLDAYRLPFLVGRGRGGDGRSGEGPELRGASLSSLRGRDGRLEARVVNLGDEPSACVFGSAETELRPWEIRTLTL
jgi:2-O-(6-phospho-alpha-D-mannosyl)-D-glycerate hydrolase